MKNEIFFQHDKQLRFSFRQRRKSFGHALDGLFDFFRMQHNAVLHFVFTIIALSSALFFRVTNGELAAIVIAVACVWAAELFNTAIEKLCDRITTAYDPAIKLIKDVSAAAVLVVSIGALITGAIIFIPKVLI